MHTGCIATKYFARSDTAMCLFRTATATGNARLPTTDRCMRRKSESSRRANGSGSDPQRRPRNECSWHGTVVVFHEDGGTSKLVASTSVMPSHKHHYSRRRSGCRSRTTTCSSQAQRRHCWLAQTPQLASVRRYQPEQNVGVELLRKQRITCCRCATIGQHCSPASCMQVDCHDRS